MTATDTRSYRDGYLDGLNAAADILRGIHDHHRQHNAHVIAVRDWAVMHWAWDEAFYGIRQLEIAAELDPAMLTGKDQR